MTLTPDQQAEIDEQRATTQPTLRATVPGMEEHLYKAIPVLDHGFVRVDRLHGRRQRHRAGGAGVSYGKGTKAVRTTRG